jgi:uncharacterized protein YggE
VSEHSHAERMPRRIELSAEELDLLLGPGRFASSPDAGATSGDDAIPAPDAPRVADVPLTHDAHHVPNAPSAADAMQQQATTMNGVFAAVKAAGIADRDMQTGNLSLNPVYEYPNNARPRLTGYQASNQLMIKVRKLDTLGKTLDAVVKAGGNTINGVTFSVDQPEKFQNDARVEAIKDAAAKAELYAKAVGYKVKRIVTISEIDYSPQPMPMMQMRMQDMAAEATPIAAGEVSLRQTVNVMFELTK